MSNPAAELFFEKISHYDRPQEPVTCGIPFPRGAMSQVEQFALHDGAAEVYCQKSVTGRWDDGSIRWLLVHCLLDLPGGSGKSFRFTVEDQARDPVAPPAALTLADGDEAVLLDTGPLRATLSISGKHRRGADDFLDYVIRIHAWAGKSCLAVQYQFINREARPRVAIREIHLAGPAVRGRPCREPDIRAGDLPHPQGGQRVRGGDRRGRGEDAARSVGASGRVLLR